MMMIPFYEHQTELMRGFSQHQLDFPPHLHNCPELVRMRAGQLKGTVEVYVLNPGARVNYTIGIVLDTENSDPSLELGATEKNEYQVLLSNRYPQPSQWDASVVGDFSEDKYAFMVTILGKLYDPWADWSSDIAVLLDAAL